MMEITKVRSIETITGEIKALQNTTLSCIIEIGRRLCEAKELLPHGEWGDWLKNKVDFSQSTANNFMKIFQEYGSAQSALYGTDSNSQTFENLSYTKALRLLALPENEREEFVSEHDVENLSVRKMDELIKERDEALKAKTDAEQRVSAVERERSNALTVMQENTAEHNKKLEEANRKIRELSNSLEDLRNNPIEVEVAKADPAEMEAALAKAKEEAEAERKKAIAEIEKQLKAAEKEKSSAQDAKTEAESKMKKLLEDIEAEKRKTAAVEQQLETLRKAQVMSDPIVTEFGVLFKDVQEKLERLTELLDKAGDKKPNLAAALNRALNTYKVNAEVVT